MLTRRDLILKWTTYALVVLAFCFLHSITFAHMRLFRAIPFLPPVLLAAICSLENDLQSSIFAIVFGVLCDLTLPGPFPCLYTVSFLLAALVIVLLAHSVFQPGFFCSLAAVIVAFSVLDFFCALPLLLTARASLTGAVSLFFRELLASSILLLPCYPAFSFLRRMFTI